MKKKLILLILICSALILIGCSNGAGSDELREKFIGKTFSGKTSDSYGSDEYEINDYRVYTFYFVDEDTVTLTKSYMTFYGNAYNTNDTERDTTEDLSYAVKKTLSGKSYVFIEGFGSDGKDTSKTKKGLRVELEESGEIDYFVYETSADTILMHAE